MNNVYCIFIDYDNDHGRFGYDFLSNHLSIPIIWEKISSENTLKEILRKYQRSRRNIFCIPLSWDSDGIENTLIVNIAKKNIMNCPKDEDNLYPWSLYKVIVADGSIWLFNKNPDGSYATMQGTSARCLFNTWLSETNYFYYLGRGNTYIGGFRATIPVIPYSKNEAFFSDPTKL